MSARTARLQQLIRRRDKVLAVLHPPSAAHARIMEQAGCEALFVGTGGVAAASSAPIPGSPTSAPRR
jgi:2-methylisocitrate lyase-like PEP mutase family enzyme